MDKTWKNLISSLAQTAIGFLPMMLERIDKIDTPRKRKVPKAKPRVTLSPRKSPKKSTL